MNGMLHWYIDEVRPVQPRSADRSPQSQPTLVPGLRLWLVTFDLCEVAKADVPAATAWASQLGDVVDARWFEGDEWAVHECPACNCTDPDTVQITVRVVGETRDDALRAVRRAEPPAHRRALEAA